MSNKNDIDNYTVVFQHNQSTKSTTDSEIPIPIDNFEQQDNWILAGEGYGATRHGGAGGAGAFDYDTNVLLTAGNYIIKVGNGGIQANNQKFAEEIEGHESSIIKTITSETIY